MEDIKRKDPRKGLESEAQSTPEIEKNTASDESHGGDTTISKNKSEENVAPSGEIVTNTGADIDPAQGDADAASG
jgi:hypothetical protein